MRKIIFWSTIIIGGLSICVMAPLWSGSFVGVQTAEAQFIPPLSQLRTGPNNAITDVPGVKVGHYTDEANYTGATVVLVEKGATPGAEIRGGCPGTISVDILDPDKCFDKEFGISLAGGSCFGYAANIGLRQWLMERDLGVASRGASPVFVPAAAGAIIFDLGRFGKPDWKKTPTYDFGYNAANNAQAGPVQQGNVGGGMGAISGGIKGGVGTASMDLGNGVMVGALVVNNTLGTTFDPETREFWARHLEITDAATGRPEFYKYGLKKVSAIKPGKGNYYALQNLRSLAKSPATAIGVVVTNITLSKAQAKRLAIMAMDGQGKAIRPSATYFDGDSVFALATGDLPLSALGGVDSTWGEASGWVTMIGMAAADCYSRAFIHSVLNATSIGDVKSYHDTYKKSYRLGKWNK
jgi:L-aminopeptidase/D-esterase-like protein